jgi:hypothetical protein
VKNDSVFVYFCINFDEGVIKMSNKQTGGPAFPYSWWDEQTGANAIAKGMTLRDYFAAKAMQGFLASADDALHPDMVDKIAVICYRVADAMLSAREE